MPNRAFIAMLLAATAAAAQFEPDDATGRRQARDQMDGPRSAETDLIIQREALREAQKWRLTAEKFRTGASVASTSSVASGAAAVQAGTWVNVGPSAGSQLSPLPNVAVDSGRVSAIVAHPADPSILYVATAGGGVWKTFDAQTPITSSNGPHWFSITSDLASQSVGALALDARNPDTLFLGLGDPFDVQTAGFYRSFDGGATWQGPETLSGTSGTATSVRDIVIDPSGYNAADAATPGTVIAATDAGVFRSVNNQAWQQVDTGGYSDCWSAAWMGQGTWVVACWGAVFRSADNGASFTQVSLPSSDVGRMTLAAAAGDTANPSTAWVYLLASNGGGGDQGDVFLSENGGQTFVSLDMGAATSRYDNSFCNPGGGDACKSPLNWVSDQDTLDVLHDQAWYNQAIAVDPRNHLKVFIGGNLTMLRSDDAGHNWRVMADWMPASPLCTPGCNHLPYVHADWHAMTIATYSGNATFYAGTDGGLFRSTDVFTRTPDNSNSDTTTMPSFEGRIGRGLVSHLAYSIATDLHDSSNPVLIGGLQDNGTRMRVGGAPTVFNQVIGADGFGVGLGISNSSAAPASCKGRWGSLLLGSMYGVIFRSVDCGNSFAAAMTGICKPGSQILNPVQGCAAEYNSNFFMKLASDQADATGQTFLTVINNSSCDPNASQCTAAYGTNTVYVTHDGASNTTGWTKANGSQGNFPNQLISVSTNPKAPGQWAVSDASYAYVTTDSGAHWTRGDALAGPVRSVAFEGTSATAPVIWAASGHLSARGGGHVFRSVGGTGWVDESANLPNVPAKVVAVDPGNSGVVYLGTEIGLYVTRDGGQSWSRYGGSSLPLVSVTEINVGLDGRALRISTFGRGFWELYPDSAAASGVYGNGDFDHNQVIDGFDLVRESALLGVSAADPGYDPAGNLTGSNNAVDGADFSALVAKLGGRP